MSKEIISIIFDLFKTKGSNLQYGNENVNQLEHALQCAELAEKGNHSKEIITAALLHDIGHLLYDGKDPIHKGIDGRHENLGADYIVIGRPITQSSDPLSELISINSSIE